MLISNTQQSLTDSSKTKASPVKVSFIIEWANTTYNGIPRFFTMLDILARQWQAMVNREYPDRLTPVEQKFLQSINPKPEVLIVSGENIEPGLIQKITSYSPGLLDPVIHVKRGLEYYALKNFGAELAQGDILCFLDSDVHPDKDWLIHLFSTFSNPEICGVAGQPYVAPINLFSRAFALGWTYQLPERTESLVRSKKWYANNVAFRSKIFHKVTFPKLERRTRGARHLMVIELAKMGYEVYENRKALVNHPAPSSWKNMIIRALAHGRDIYMRDSEKRSFQGFIYSQKTAARRLMRGISNTFKNWRKVGLDRFETIPVILIITCYYIFFSLGGVLTHISPEIMGRNFRL